MFIKAELKSIKRLNQTVAGQSSISGYSQNQSAPAQVSTTRGWKKSPDEIVVGLDRDLELIRDKLLEDQKKVDIVSIVGMGGIGKTMLATKVFNDGYVKHHFHIRVWVTVSQTYDKRDVLFQILESIHGQLNLEKASDSRLREMVHKHLMGKRYLIVIDDIWSIETLDNLKLFFPHDNTGSRIILTSRLNEVAKHANSDGLIHCLGYLNKERSWELLCQKVFRGNKCPRWSIKPGMQIVENCKGLPLAVVVIAGVLAKETQSEEFGVEIAEKTGLYIVNDQNGCMETLGLSYSHLPLHLRECFHYLGGFLEDYMFKVRETIWLWVAEGFIQQDGNRSLEDIAADYLADLIDRNLVIVADMSEYDGTVKACKVHDLVRELCLRKAKEEGFNFITESLTLSAQFSDVITQPYKPVRMFVNKYIKYLGFPYSLCQNLRSVLFLTNWILSYVIANGLRSFELLRVLDIRENRLFDFPKDMELLVHLRYLAVCNVSNNFPSSICNLWGLQTLIYIAGYNVDIVLPSNISDLVNLRHLWNYGNAFVLRSIEKPMNLQTISYVMLSDGIDNPQKCFPYIKGLTCSTYSYDQNDFKSLTYLQKLKVTGFIGRAPITFPTSLKRLILKWCSLPWYVMSIIQSLPNLLVLKLKNSSFKGNCWNTDEQGFSQLKFLRLEELDIKVWEAYNTSFPCLRQLEIVSCLYLEEIPLEIGDIPTLELIQIKRCRHSVGESARRIEEEQHDLGNFDLKIHII